MGTNLTAEDVIAKYRFADAYNGYIGDLAGKDIAFWTTVEPSGAETLISGIVERAPTGVGDWPTEQRTVLDKLLSPIPELEYGATEVAGGLVSSVGDTLGIAALAGFAAVAVANVVITRKTEGAWAAALEAGEDIGIAAAGLVFVGGVSMDVAESAVPAFVVESLVTGLNYYSLIALADGVANLQARLTAISTATANPPTDPTKYAPTLQLGNPLPSTTGQLIAGFNQTEIDGTGGNDTLLAYNVAIIHGGDGNDFIMSTSAGSSNKDDVGYTEIDLGKGNNTVVASGAFNIYGGSGYNFVVLPVGVADQQFNAQNTVSGGSAGSSILQYVASDGDDSHGVRAGVEVCASSPDARSRRSHIAWPAVTGREGGAAWTRRATPSAGVEAGGARRAGSSGRASFGVLSAAGGPKTIAPISEAFSEALRIG
jgi:hypothetical protein